MGYFKAGRCEWWYQQKASAPEEDELRRRDEEPQSCATFKHNPLVLSVLV